VPKEPSSESQWRALLADEMVCRGRYYYRIAWGILRDAGAAEDVCQQAVVTALERPDELRAGGSMRAWLTRIVVRTSLHILRRRKTEHRALELRARCSPASPAGDGAWVMREAVLDAVEKLPEPARSIVTLRSINEMTVKEVMEMLDCSAVHVSRHMHKGMEMLRGVLREFRTTRKQR
jgi:RNA polymerase sigma factor (sigma-70 family)